MKKAFIETKYEGELDLPKNLINQLPQKVMLATTIQFTHYLNEIKIKLSAYKKEIYFFQSAHCRTLGQILGCDNFKIRPGIEAFLYLGDGEFHPKALLANELPIFCYNPLNKTWKIIGKREVEQLKLRNKVKMNKFYSSNTIGIITSIKDKQKTIQGPANQLKEELEKKGKEVYLFLAEEIRDLENFNFIEFWINTACPRINDDFDNLINLNNLKS